MTCFSTIRLILAGFLVVFVWSAIGSADEPQDRVDFVRDIQPILQTKCVDCHGTATAKSGLRLDLKSAALAGGDTGIVIIPKQSQNSLLIARITSAGDDKMPPKGTALTPTQIDLMKRWIDAGADWPDGVDRIPSFDKYDWWSLRPLSRPSVPTILEQPSQRFRIRTPIDAFILAELHKKGLSPSPEADRQTLVRRLYFDLIGLPPTPEQTDDFIRDPDPNAYDRLVDALLQSPHYGERWARHWLDVVHYGDTHGYDKDKPRPNAWPYRDYVIRALNDDKPYERFVHEQIAGDVFWPLTEDGITGTGFIAAGPWDFIGHAEVPESKIDGKIARNLDRDDMVSNVCNTFLSLTVQCARCHNHKFDPVTQEDYYRLQAVFAALDRADRSYDSDSDVGRQRAILIDRQRELLTEKQRTDAALAQAGGEALKDLDSRIATASKSTNDAKLLVELGTERDHLIATLLPPSVKMERDENSRLLEEASKLLSSLPPEKKVYAGTVHTGSGSFVGTGASGGRPREIRILARGDVTQPLGIVEPGTVRLAPQSSGEFSLPENHS